MRIFLSIVTLGILLFSGFMFLAVGFGSGLGGCSDGSASCITYMQNVEIYKWASIIMVLSSLTGLIGMAKTININDGSQKFAIFAMLGILLPIIILFFLSQFVGSI